jgi:hypothetical protein
VDLPGAVASEIGGGQAAWDDAFIQKLSDTWEIDLKEQRTQYVGGPETQNPFRSALFG